MLLYVLLLLVLVGIGMVAAAFLDRRRARAIVRDPSRHAPQIRFPQLHRPQHRRE